MGRRGRKRQLEVEARYWQLIESGVGTVEACRRVGITRKTGYRWRAEVGGLVPDRLSDAVRSNRYLSKIERQRIESMHRQGLSGSEIARRLDRSPSTISCELRRNTARHDWGGYDATLAHSRARARGARPGRSRLANDDELRAVVQDKLALEWSPEQIAAHLREAYPERPRWHLCHETIYQALYRGAEAFPATKTGGVGIGSSTLSSIIPTGLQAQEYLKDIGIKVAVLQNQPVQVDNYRPYVEQWKQDGAQGIYQISAQDPTPIVQAMKNVGYNPAWILYRTQFYGPQAAKAAKALGSFPPSYVQFTSIPFDLANKYPVVQQLIDIVHGAVPNGKLTTFTTSSMSAWLLWAVSAKACGANLTVDCVLQKAKSQTAWDAGGLYPKQNLVPGQSHASPCIALVKLTSSGFAYDEKLTQPTSGDAPFNCDPANVKSVKTYIQTS